MVCLILPQRAQIVLLLFLLPPDIKFYRRGRGGVQRPPMVYLFSLCFLPVVLLTDFLIEETGQSPEQQGCRVLDFGKRWGELMQTAEVRGSCAEAHRGLFNWMVFLLFCLCLVLSPNEIWKAGQSPEQQGCRVLDFGKQEDAESKTSFNEVSFPQICAD